MKKTCIKTFEKDGCPFIAGYEYKIDVFNDLCGVTRIMAHSPFGYTDISKEILNHYFL